MLLAATFASLAYTDPFPAAAQLGQPSQVAGSVVYSESFTDQSGTSSGVLGAADRYWKDQTTLTRSLPSSMQNGLAQMSVEFWLNVPVGSAMGNGTAIRMPGFEAGGNSTWGRTPSGVISLKFSTTRSGEPLANLGQVLGVIADGQWHQYVATFDGRNAYLYSDGELVGQDWVTNTADKAGPQIFSGATVSTPTAITYSPLAHNTAATFDEVRVSNIALTPAQVRRNFENCHRYGSIWYVSPAGLATNSGTRTSPLDLTTGLTHVAADNKIVLLAGTYSGSQFQLTGSGAGALHNALITGDEGTGQAIIQTTGSGTGPTVSGGAKYVTLRNLTFSSDQQAGLSFSSSGYGNVIDGCRLTSNVDALSVVNSSGYQDPMSWDAAHYIIVPGVMLENSVLAAGTTAAGVRYNNSKVVIARNNTFTGGQYGAYLTGGSTNVTLLNNIFTQQTGAGVYFNSDSLMDVDGAYSVVSYFGDGNVYDPSGAGYVATVVDGATNNYAAVRDYAKYWYTKQYGTAILTNYGDSGSGIGTRSEQRSVRGVPAFVSRGSGDFRLAGTAPNLIDTGADRVYGRRRAGVGAVVWDAQGNLRVQGNAVDAGAYETGGAVNQTFTLATAATTSAGVYDSNGKLIRTLWSGKKYPAGVVTANWNGLNDNNVAVNNGNYTIKLLSNNVQYSWDGAMNNSNPLNGPTVQGNFLPIQSMVVIGSTAYYTPGYNEGRYMLNAFDLANPYATTARGVYLGDFNADALQSLATDGSTLFTVSEHTTNHQILLRAYAPSILDNVLRQRTVTASGGAPGGAAGIAVQPAGKQELVFVTQRNENRVYLYNKNTFAPYSTAFLDGNALGWNTPQALAINSDGDLWIACKNTASGQWQVLRYTNFDGTPTLAATVSGGLVNPVGIAVSVDGNKTLLVADSEDAAGSVHQQIRAYANTGGSTLWTLGQAGGYATNGPTITNDKFILQGMICPQSDGSFWITDLATENRTMHFSAARAFISDIQYARSYNAAADQNNATRVFQNFVEYQIDYSKAFTQNQGWTPVRNWNYLGTKNLLPTASYGGFDGLSVVSTLSNGRTYSLVNAQTVTGSSTDAGRMSLVELTASGMRNTGYKTAQNAGYWMDKDGSLITSSVINNNTKAQFTRLALTSFDGSGNPQYASATVLATAPRLPTWDAGTPYPDGTPYYAPRFLQLDNGLLVTYNAEGHAAGMHLGAVNPATNQWQWQSMPGAGPFDGKGNYDTANWYGGNRVMASGTNVVVGYNGEGWGANMGQGQANQFMHYSDDGLFVGQFGMGQLNGGGTWPGAYGSGGNSFSPFLTSNGGILYLYANDESDRSLNRWRATGLDTIQETSLAVALGAPTAPSRLTATAASGTQVNLVWTDNSTNETGFKIERATDSGFTQNLTLVTTTAAGVTSYSNTALAANTTYYYRVRATNAGTDSTNSNTAGPVMPLLQVSGDQGSAGQSDQIRVVRNATDSSLLDVFLNSITRTYAVNFAALNTIAINGLGGDDTLTLDLANGPVIPAGGISYDGGTQTTGDSLIIAGSSSNDAVTFAANQVSIGSGIVTLTNVENRSFKGGAGNDSLTLGAGSYTFASDLGVYSTRLSLSLADGAQVAFNGPQHLGSLALSGSSKVTLADGGRSTLVVQSLTLGGTSSLDLADNAVIVDYTGSSPFAAIYPLLAGSAANHWAGGGIVSHTAAGGGSQYAIGLADNGVANLASFAGQSVDGTSVLIRFTYSGDANLDGQVDLTDLSVLAGSWQMAARQWSQGEADYSGLVDLTDLVLLASNWQKVLPTPVVAGVVIPTSEVASVSQTVDAAAPVVAEVVGVTSEPAVVSQPVDAAPSASEAVVVEPALSATTVYSEVIETPEAPQPADAAATDPTPQTTSPMVRVTSSTPGAGSERLVTSLAESSPAAQPAAVAAATPVATARVRKLHAVPTTVTGRHPAGISQVTTAVRHAGVFSNRPLPVPTALAPWPITSHGTRTLLGSDRLGVDDRKDVLPRDVYPSRAPARRR